jgi:hypothetical protein
MGLIANLKPCDVTLWQNIDDFQYNFFRMQCKWPP